MRAHRTITRLAAIAVTTVAAAPAASAQAGTFHHLIAHRKVRHNGPLASATRSGLAGHRKGHLTLTAPQLSRCIGGGPLARPAEFTSYRIQPWKGFSPAAICAGVIED